MYIFTLRWIYDIYKRIEWAQQYAQLPLFPFLSPSPSPKAWSAYPSTPNLLHGDGVRSSREHSVGTSKRLSSSLQLRDVQGVAHTLVGDEVVEKVHHVTREILNLGRGHKRVDGRVTVGARVQLPGGVGDRRGSDRGAGGGDGAGTAESGEPDHDLVGVGAAGGGGEPEIVRDIGDNVGAGVAVRRS